MTAEAGDARAGIGTRLRAAREKKGLTILQAAEKMHVDSRILEALEAEDFAALGAAVYVKGHMRHYAELVGEQPAQLQEIYASSTRAAPAQPDLTRMPHVRPESDPGRLAGPAVVVLVAVAAIGAFWWLVNSPAKKVRPTEIQESAQTNTAGKPAGTQAAPAESAAGAGMENKTPSQQPAMASTQARIASGSHPGASGKTAKTVPSPPVTSSKSVAPALVRIPAATPPPGAGKSNAAGRSVINATSPPESAAAAVRTVASTSSSATAPPPTRPKEGELTLKFSSDSWAEVYDASGQRLFYDVGAAASAHTVKGPAPMRVVLGNASGVALEFNGRPAAIPSSVRPDGSVRFVVNAHGRAVPATEGN